MSIKAVTLDAYGTLVRNDDLGSIPRRIVADHQLAVDPDDVLRHWVDLYHEAVQASPFRTLRQIQADNLGRVLRRLDIAADPAPYVDLYFDVTTRVELYPEVPAALAALGALPSAIVSNADHEHVASWRFELPVRFVLISEAVGAYKPGGPIFRAALDRLGLRPDEVLHVGDSDVDDVQGAKAAGLRAAWVNRDGRARRRGVPAPDFEIRDLSALAALL
jgi:2-haloalkanoic acid dehalogenase type II